MKIEIEQQGLDDLLKGLAALEENVSVNTIRASLRAAAKPMLNEAARRAPVDIDDENGYHLSEAMQLRTERKRNRRSAVHFRLGPSRETRPVVGENDYPIIGGLSKSKSAPNYAQIVEQDTPFLLPAFDAEAQNTVERFAEDLMKRIPRALKRAGR